MSKRRELAIFIGFALIGAAVFGWFFPSFPTATIPMEHSESDAQDISSTFLQEHGHDVSGYERNTSFYTADGTSTYLQRTLPWRSAKDAILAYDVYYWETGYYSQTESDEFYVGVDPVEGDVVYFYHYLPDDVPGARLSNAEARNRAKQFLESQGHDVDQYELVKQSTTNLSERRDHTFVWEHAERGVGGAPFHVEVEVQGDEIGYYEEYLNISDQFYDSYFDQQLQDQLLLGAGFLGLSAVLGIAALVYGLRYFKRDAFDARFALSLGGIVAALTLVGTVNSLPSVLQFVPLDMPSWPWVAAILVGAAISALFVGGITAVFAGTGKQLVKEVLQHDIVDTLSAIRADADVRQRVAYGLARGFFLAWIILGFYTLFYLVGTTYFDVWLPADTPTVLATATYVPAVVALTTAGTAAVWEEVAYRLFAIPLCKRHLRYTSLAVLIPAFVWGLGHSGYAVLPVYVRVIEVTLIGLLLGAVFLRYGLLTTVAAHFSLNALAVGVPMLLARTNVLLFHGVISVSIAFLPIVVAGIITAYGRRT